jgi:hypothetical protein
VTGMDVTRGKRTLARLKKSRREDRQVKGRPAPRVGEDRWVTPIFGDDTHVIGLRVERKVGAAT